MFKEREMHSLDLKGNKFAWKISWTEEPGRLQFVGSQGSDTNELTHIHKWEYNLKFPHFFLSSVQFSCSIMSDCLRPHGLQHARLPCSSPTPRACSNLCLLSQWCYPNISSSVIPFSSCLQSFPASGSFPISQLFTSGGQRIGVSASASALPMNIQGLFPSGLIPQ